MKNLERGEGIVSNILAVAGFIILIAIIVWGAFHFLNLASSSFSSLLSRGKSNTIQISLPGKTTQSGQPLDVSWKFSPAGNGTYAFLYQCKENFQFKIGASSGSMSAIPCGAAYTVAPASVKSVRVVPVLSSGTSLDMPFSIIFMQSGTSTTAHPQGSATITVTASAQNNTGATSTPSMTQVTPTNTQPANSGSMYGGQTTQQPAATTQKKAGPADLSVRILAVGIIDPMTGMFAARPPLYAGDIVAVQFDIANIGRSATGAWSFSALLPTTPTSPYMSPMQRSLSPGDHIVNTLRFDHVAQGGGTFSVTVDGANRVYESSESNNYASEWVTGGYNQEYRERYPTPAYPGYYPYQY